MSQVSSLGCVGAYFLRHPHEPSDGFIREHEGKFLVCIPSLVKNCDDEFLYEIVADCRYRNHAELLLSDLGVKPCPSPPTTTS